MPGSSFQPPINLDPNQDSSQQLAFTNQNFQSLANALNPIQINDGSNNRVLLGKDSVGNYGLKVSKAGYDAFNAADANLIFNSSQDIFKIVTKVTVTVPSFSLNSSAASKFEGPSLQQATYTHNLGYKPIVIGYENNGSNVLAIPYTEFFTSANGAAGWTTVRIATDTNTVAVGVELLVASTPTFGMNLTFSGATYTLYLLQETAT